MTWHSVQRFRPLRGAMRPPPTWLADGLGAVSSGPGLGDVSRSSMPAVSAQQVEETGRLLDEDDARQWDLAQQLRVETGPQYAQQPVGVRGVNRAPRVGGTACFRLPDDGPNSASESPFPPQWPPLLSVVQHRQLPSVVEERMLTRQVFSLCGLFPEIHRAWATVDNALFLWRYDAQYVATPCRCFCAPRTAVEDMAGRHLKRRVHNHFCRLTRPGCLPPLLPRLPRSDQAPLEFTVPDVALVSVTLCTPRTGAHFCPQPSVALPAER